MTVVNRRDLPVVAGAQEFQGYLHGDAQVSLIFVDGPPGSGPRLHRHPYTEIFVVQEGRARFIVGDETIEAQADQVLIVPPGVPHTFVNIGDGPLRQLDIHLSERFDTEWLED